jgi:hypothetical protein
MSAVESPARGQRLAIPMFRGRVDEGVAGGGRKRKSGGLRLRDSALGVCTTGESIAPGSSAWFAPFTLVYECWKTLKSLPPTAISGELSERLNSYRWLKRKSSYRRPFGAAPRVLAPMEPTAACGR